jgi:hypothetical protein
MKVLGSFPSVEDPETFFFIRGFPDISSREPTKGRSYEGKVWEHEPKNVLMPTPGKYEVAAVEDLDNVVHW